MRLPATAGGTGRWLGAVLGCGATLGALEAARALLALPHVEPADGFAVVGYSVVAHAAAAFAAALVLRPGLGRALNRQEAVEGTRSTELAAAGAVAIGVLVTVLRWRSLIGLAQPELLAFAPGCLLEGGAAGLLAGWALARLAARTQRAIWGGLALLAGAVALGAIVLPLVRGSAAPGEGSSPRPNILLISVDTLRADRLGAYGRDPSFTPNLDQLAAEGALFENAVAPIALTGPSHTSMLTGLYPVHHGATNNGVHPRRRVETVAESLARAGYRTGGFISGWPLTDRSSGLAQRFGTYDENLAHWPWLPQALERVPLLWLVDRVRMFATYAKSNHDLTGRFHGELFERAGERTAEQALRWIEQSGARPFFAFVHLYEPHGPYTPPAEIRHAIDPSYTGTVDAFDWRIGPEAVRELFSDPRAVERIKALYEGEVARVDAIVGELLSGLERSGHAGDTLVIFTADHGESLTEHGEYFDHHDRLYETVVHVPLLLRFPDRRFAGVRSAQVARLIDLAPTLLEVARLPSASGLDGASLLPLLEQSAPATERIAFGSQNAEGYAMRSRHYVRASGLKLIWTLDEREHELGGPAQEELYDLVADPGELHNLALGAPPPGIEELRARLAAWVAERSEEHAVIDPEVRQRLQSLGYL